MAFPTGWARKCELTIDHTYVDGDLTNFPVLFTVANLPSEMFDADGSHPALNGGGDIRFSSDEAGTTQLACQVVSFVTNNNPAIGTAEIHVKVPSVAGASNTTLWVWYEKAAESQPVASDTYGSESVWVDYAAVWHMSQDPSGSAPQILDSTANDNHGTSAGSMTSGDLVSGQVGNAIDFDGGDDEIQIAEHASLRCGDRDFTVEAVVNMPAVSGTYGVFCRQGGGYYLRINSSKVNFLQSQVADILSGGTNVGTGAPHHIAATVGAGGTADVNVWLDGVSDGNTTTANGFGAVSDVRIGSQTSGGGEFLPGVIDEVRISSVARSAAWIDATYNTLFNTAAFVTAGTPENAAGAAAIPRFRTVQQAVNRAATF